MNEGKLTKVILAPCVSEKSTRVQVDRQYVFKVSKQARKDEIVRAAKLMFNVDVEAIRITNVPEKKRVFANIKGRKKEWKKAYITVKEGQSINLGGV